jgi:hypothetical protein
MPPWESDMAMTFAPSEWSRRATMLPAFPAPWTTTRDPFSGIFSCLAASRTTNWQPRAVASLRPSEPPTESGFPVTTPRAE